MAATPRTLVVDADVARRATASAFPASVACYGALRAIRASGHRIAMCADLLAEWRAHRSQEASIWLSQMFGEKRVDNEEDCPDTGLSSETDAHSTSDRRREATWKDRHVVELALAKDRRVLSADEKAYAAFHAVAIPVTRLQSVVWVNPEREADGAVAWLQAGAPDEESRRIGARPVLPP